MNWIYGDTIEGRAKMAAEVLLTSLQEDALFGQGAYVLNLFDAASHGLSEGDASQASLEAVARMVLPEIPTDLKETSGE